VSWSDQFYVDSDQNIRCKDPNRCREPTRRDVDAAQRSARRQVEEPAPPHAREIATGDSFADEASLFYYLTQRPITDAVGLRYGIPPEEFLLVTSGAGGLDSIQAYSVSTAGATMEYLYNLMTAKKRPASWDGQARRKMRELADWLLTVQYGAPGATGEWAVPVSATEAGAYSGYDSSHAYYGRLFSYQTGVAMKGMLRAYQIFADPRYLQSAKEAARCLRRWQCGDLRNTNFSSTASAGGGPYHHGVWTSSLTLAGCIDSPVPVASITSGVIVLPSTPSESDFEVTVQMAGPVTWGTWTAIHRPSGNPATWNTTLQDADTWTKNASLPGPLQLNVWYDVTVTADLADPCKAQVISFSVFFQGGGIISS
jgi:hypothetical protein